MTNPYRRSAGLAALTAAVIGLAACSGSNAPHVASLGQSNHGGTPGATTTTLPKGNPTELLDEWASCMRSNGTPGVADPTIDTNGVIHISLPATGDGPSTFSDQGGPCGNYLQAASKALRGGQPLQKPDPAKLLKFSRCMQANGIPDFPDPSGGGLSIRVSPGSDLSPQNPTFQAASKLCAKKTGVPAFGTGTPPRGAINVSSGSGPGGGPGGGGSSSSGIATGGGGPAGGSGG